ncbi:hypothetical protein [Azospirillum palustre]
MAPIMKLNQRYMASHPFPSLVDHASIGRSPIELLRFLVFEKDGEATIDQVGEPGAKLLQERNWVRLSYCAEEVFVLATEEGRRVARTQRPSAQ